MAVGRSWGPRCQFSGQPRSEHTERHARLSTSLSALTRTPAPLRRIVSSSRHFSTSPSDKPSPCMHSDASIPDSVARRYQSTTLVEMHACVSGLASGAGAQPRFESLRFFAECHRASAARSRAHHDELRRGLTEERRARRR
jgi:hypothetical protein